MWDKDLGQLSCITRDQLQATITVDLLAEVVRLTEENKKLKFMIDEGLGWEDMQQDSMQSHIN